MPGLIRLLLCWVLLAVSCAAAAVPVRVDVIVENGDAELEKNVRLLLSIEQQKDHELMNEGRLRRLHQKAKKEIGQALQPFGYYRPQVEAKLSRQAEGDWLAVYRVQPGEAIPVSVLDLRLSASVEKEPAFATLLSAQAMKAGEAFKHSHYESLKSALLTLAAERGYFDARFTRKEVQVDLQLYQARVYLHFDAGTRYAYGAINVSSGILDEELMKGFVAIQSGQPYLIDELVATRQALNDSDYFQSVEVSPGEPDNANHTVPVEVTLKPRRKNRYTIGLGYGTDTGARVGFGWEKPLINRHGHRFGSELKLSEIGTTLAAHYRVPVLNPRTDQLIYRAALSEEITDTSKSRTDSIGVALERGRDLWRESLSLTYQSETFTVADVRDTSRLLIPGANWTRSWGRNSIITLDGLRIDIGVKGASQELFSDASFLQLRAGIKFIQRLGSRHRLIARGRLGATETDEFDALPASVRFFAGGSQSVRGFSYQSLGPTNADGEVEGGKHLMVGGIELERRFTGNWGGAIFYDAGNAINSVDDTLERGAGFGLRWQSPVGPVRIDLASAISRDDDPWRLHINIGPDL